MFHELKFCARQWQTICITYYFGSSDPGASAIFASCNWYWWRSRHFFEVWLSEANLHQWWSRTLLAGSCLHRASQFNKQMGLVVHIFSRPSFAFRTLIIIITYSKKSQELIYLWVRHAYISYVLRLARRERIFPPSFELLCFFSSIHFMRRGGFGC